MHSHVPDDPVGVVFVFHGTGGSADIVTKIEVVDQLNALVERGYAWVATESTDRTATRRWVVGDASLTTNPDLARLGRLHAALVETTAITAATPIFGIGMSNGARMVTLFGEAFHDAGLPVAAVAPFMGQAANPVRAGGGLSIPGFWVIAANDQTVPNPAIVADQAANEDNGVASVLAVKHEESLLSLRFTRIPAVDGDEAAAITDALAATGVWDERGRRVVSIDEALRVLPTVSLPAGTGATSGQIADQVGAILAVHEFVGLFREAVADFFDARLP